jgi:hypothetical protein
MRRTKPTTLAIGSISNGTLRAEDLIPAMLDALEPLRLTRAERNIIQRARIQHDYLEQDREAELDESLTDLYTIADDHCPDYCYCGATEGDGAEIGVWPNHDSIADDIHGGTIRACTDCNVPDDPPGDTDQTHAHCVNDHGNSTLYRRAGRRWVECWSVV